ncbi:Canalicular multispecific organic anion transporter 2, partial [Coemansia helicoidea]
VTDGRVVVVEQANIGYRGTLAMPSPKGAARDTATQSSKGEFTMAPEITVPPFSAALVRKFLALSGYAAVLACIAVQFACAYSFYYIERTRMELMAGSGTHMDSANVRRFLLVSMGVAIARSAATELGEWLRNTLWFERVLAKMQRLLLDSLLSTPLAVVERLPQHTLYMLFNSELIGVALMLPREICIRTYDASLAGYSLLNSAQVMSVAVIPLLLLVIAQRRFTRRVDVAVNQMRMECGQQAMHRKINLIHELLAGHEVVRIHGVASAYVHKLLQLGTAHAHTAWVVSHMDRFTPVLSAAAAELPVLCILAWMKWRQCVLGLPVSPGDVHITVDLAQGSFLKLSSLTMSSSNMAHFSPLLAKFYAYAENLPREAPRLIADHRPPTNWPSEGTIGVRDYRMPH